MVKYTYDAWGHHGVEVLDSSLETLANINPFRYRSYYYDAETELYFLKTRYYDPEIGRFMTIDGIEYLDPETINGLNLYAYCGNNPVMNVDPNGTFWLTTILVGMLIGSVIGGAASAGVTAIQGGTGKEIFASFVGGAITGGVLGLAATTGGALAVGVINATTLSVSLALVGTTMISFIGGVGAYAAERGIKGEKIDIQEMLTEGAITSVQSLFNFGVGALMGAAGFWDSLSPGNTMFDSIKASRQIYIQELGYKGLGVISHAFAGFLHQNISSILIRTFYKQVFSLPWNFIKP